MCKEQVDENEKHILLECSYFSEERTKYLKHIIEEKVGPESQRLTTNNEIIVSKLLGGERQASCRRKIYERIEATSKFLSSIVPKRLAKLASLKVTAL
jgi:tRNA A22 N-methylase